jgi:putative endonuclease
MKKQQLGTSAEQYACAYLQKQGLKLVTSNFRCRLGEIDLIMYDGQELVFVEVRYRKDNSAAASVTSYKQQKIIRAAYFYLQQQRLSDKVICRFDVVAVAAKQLGWQLNWIKNAFSVQ